jgi:hypothetical protein
MHKEVIRFSRGHQRMLIRKRLPMAVAFALQR